MPRGEQVMRQWRLLRLLQRRSVGVPLRDLQDELEVSERTIQRDLELLIELGFPIEHEADESGRRYWRIPTRYLDEQPMILQWTEAISLHLAQDLFAPLVGTQFYAGLQSLLGKIRSELPSRALEHFRDLEQMIHVRRPASTDYSDHADAIATLTAAARNQQRVTLRYHSFWRRDQYTTCFEPYGLVLFDGDLFAVGHSERAKALRVFKVSRIADVAETNEAFKRPEDFDLANYFGHSFGIMPGAGEPIEVEVRFAGPAAGLVDERVWHETQELTWQEPPATLFELPDAGERALRARFTLTSVVEFKRWLLGFGAQAEVLQPAWLREDLRRELAAAAGLYRS